MKDNSSNNNYLLTKSEFLELEKISNNFSWLDTRLDFFSNKIGLTNLCMLIIKLQLVLYLKYHNIFIFLPFVNDNFITQNNGLFSPLFPKYATYYIVKYKKKSSLFS